MSSTPTFGEQFLEEARLLLKSNPLDYETTQRVKAMRRDEVIDLLRKNSGATYADIQRFKGADDPRELAQYLYEALRRGAPASGSEAAAMMLGFFMT